MFLNFKTVRNIRDLGGISLKEGEIKYKLLLRGGDLYSLSKEEFLILKNDFNLKTVIDFRSKNSFYIKKDQIDSSITYYHYFTSDFLDQNLFTINIAGSFDEFFMKVYENLAISENALRSYHQFIKNIIDTKEGAVYFHCTSGKDRTSIAATILLLILGASKEVIYQEHLLTNEYTKKELEEYLKKHPNISKKEYDFMYATYITKKEYLDCFFKNILDKFKTIDNYLINGLKLTKEDFKTLRTRYINYK